MVTPLPCPWDHGTSVGPHNRHSLSLATKNHEVMTNTRRGMLSDLHSFFDRIGFTSPFLLRGKLIYQTCLNSFPDLGWDEVLPPRILGKWKYFINQLQGLRKLKIPWWCTGLNTASDVTLHVFFDASSQAYGATAYMANGNIVQSVSGKISNISAVGSTGLIFGYVGQN